MSRKSLITILAILVIPVVAFWGLTFNKEDSTAAVAVTQIQNTGKPQVIKFSSTMCLECKEVEKVFEELLPQYKDKITYTEIIVDSRNDMKNNLIKKYNVQLVPTVIMLNSDGTQNTRIEGARSKEDFEQCIKGLK
ncbi:thioredoxin family protein [bacterium]|nr:thioredoxin family protein [bacterium]